MPDARIKHRATACGAETLPTGLLQLVIDDITGLVLHLLVAVTVPTDDEPTRRLVYKCFNKVAQASKQLPYSPL